MASKFSMERFFRALADPTRLRILNLLGADEVCVCFLVEILKTNQPNISRHLAYLRGAGIVSSRREGKWMHYRIAAPPDTHAANVLNHILSALREDKAMVRERARLVRVFCARDLPVSLRSAPRPQTYSISSA